MACTKVGAAPTILCVRVRLVWPFGSCGVCFHQMTVSPVQRALCHHNCSEECSRYPNACRESTTIGTRINTPHPKVTRFGCLNGLYTIVSVHFVKTTPSPCELDTIDHSAFQAGDDDDPTNKRQQMSPSLLSVNQVEFLHIELRIPP